MSTECPVVKAVCKGGQNNKPKRACPQTLPLHSWPCHTTKNKMQEKLGGECSITFTEVFCGWTCQTLGAVIAMASTNIVLLGRSFAFSKAPQSRVRSSCLGGFGGPGSWLHGPSSRHVGPHGCKDPIGSK